MIERGEFLTAITILEGPLKNDPANEELTALALTAGEGHLNYLAQNRGPEEAKAWVHKTIEERPFLERLKKHIPRIEAQATFKELQKAYSHNLYSKLRELYDRFPESPEVPYMAAEWLTGPKCMMIEVALWPYKLALERGGYKGDEKIFEACIKTFERNHPNDKNYNETAHEILSNPPPRERCSG